MICKALLVVLALIPAVSFAEVKIEDIFESAPFASCHASTVVELRDGEVLAAWFGGTKEGNPDTAIWISRRTAAGWSAPSVAIKEPKTAMFNPVLFYTADEKLWLYYKFGPNPMSWSAGRMWSADDGKTWSNPEHLPAGLLGPIRAKPLVLEDGTIVAGSSVESYGSWAAWIERSADGGKSWRKIGPITAPENGGIIQPSVISLGGDKLRLYARSKEQVGKICIAESNDLGLNWTQARTIDLPNPNSGIDALAMKDGRVALVYNHSTRERTPLNLSVSRDGLHFTMFRTLESEPGEFSYPAMIQARNGDLLITYTWKRERIRFVRVPLADVPDVN